MKRLRQLAQTVCVLAFSVAIASSAFAQVGSTTGAIIGTVTDNTKAVIPGVTITVSGPALMGTRTVVTGTDGGYRIPSIPPGTYTLVFELDGFGKVTRAGIEIGVGFTATINPELSPASVSESVTVNGSSPVVDTSSTKVSTNYTAEKLAELPGSRDYAAVTSFLPAASMSRPSVGGTGSVTYQRSIRYGLRGHDRGEIEGIVTTEAAAGGQEVAYSDSDSFTDMALNVLGNGADMPNPGTLTKVVSKSGANTYHGRVNLDMQGDKFEAHNIDASQLALGLKTVGTVPIEDSNRTVKFRDFGTDLGGYIFKDKLWFYGAYRNEFQSQNELTLLDDVHELELDVKTLKLDWAARTNNKLSWYWFRGTKRQNHSILANLSDTAIVTGDALQTQTWPNGVWKVEYNGIRGNSMVYEVRGGNFFEQGIYDGIGTAPRYQDTGANRNYGNAGFSRSNHHRPQMNGSVTYFKEGWGGSHSFKFGGEGMDERSWGSSGAYNNLLMILNNGVPSQVRVYDNPVESGKRGIWAFAGYVQDGWKVNSRVTLNLGYRLDQMRSFVPAQVGPGGQQFPEYKAPVWTYGTPRVGIVYDLTGDGKTLIKGNYGQYYQFPYTSIADTMNPVPAQSSKLYGWTPVNPQIVNGFPVYQPGQEGVLISVTGARADGRAATLVDPNLKDGYSRQALVYLEREVASDFGVRSGFVWNGQRQGNATYNANQPFEAFNVPISVRDPGPDGTAGNADDGPLVQAWNLDAAHLALPIDQQLRNTPYTKNDYYTWEVMASRRQKGRWGLQTSFARTWHNEGNNAVTPNALINTEDGRDVYTSWSTKLASSIDVWKGVRINPMLRVQAGQPFARTFQARLNYNTAVLINAEPVGAERLPTSKLFDLRAQRTFKAGPSTFGIYFDVYNVFNNNATQEITRSSGALFLRPTVVTAPRIARIGLKFNF
jgi:hypothetical protein